MPGGRDNLEPFWILSVTEIVIVFLFKIVIYNFDYKKTCLIKVELDIKNKSTIA